MTSAPEYAKLFLGHTIEQSGPMFWLGEHRPPSAVRQSARVEHDPIYCSETDCEKMNLVSERLFDPNRKFMFLPEHNIRHSIALTLGRESGIASRPGQFTPKNVVAIC